MNWLRNISIAARMTIFTMVLSIMIAGTSLWAGVQMASSNGFKGGNALFWIAVVVTVLVAVLAATFLVRSVQRPLLSLLKGMQASHDHDTDGMVEASGKDLVAQVAALHNELVADRQASGVLARALANGDLNVAQLSAEAKDPVLQQLRIVAEKWHQFITELERMAKEHELGDIDVVMNASELSGIYRQMATSVNDLVQSHITIKKKAMACVAEFAKGNFAAELEKFPGKKAFINDNLELLRKNLIDVNSEIGRLIEASKAGQLSERADEKKFEGDWAVLMNGLNGLIGAIIEPVNEAALVLEEMSKGNLDVAVNGNYKGDHAKIKKSLNDTIQTLSAYVGEISEVLTEVANGNLDVAITREYRGDFTNIKTSLNHTVESMSGYINEISHVLGEIAEGNLQVQTSRDYVGDFEAIKTSLIKITEALSDTLTDIQQSADQVAMGAHQVSESAMVLSQGATEQASAVEELTATMEQISAQTKINSNNANQANELALTAKVQAERGNEHMSEMLNAMEEINESSTSISKIIKVIDEIAFQTNILALNAAVEAARAGQHGKGFAVVAEEVRNLAARSADAAKETTMLIESSMGKVADGSKIASETATALEQIVHGIADMANLVGGIADASNEQAAGITQVNQGIIQVSKVVQINSASSEEGAAASQELSSQAEVLKTMVGRFSLKDERKRAREEVTPDMLRVFDRMRSSKTSRSGRGSSGLALAIGGGDLGKY